MTNIALTFLTVAAAVGSGLVAGFFFAFSAVTMQSLGRVPAEQGIAVMQTINVIVLNAWFFSAFFGTAVISLILAVYSLLYWQAPVTIYLLLGAGLYLAGGIFVTIAFNVPLNNALAAVEPDSADAAHLWSRYLSVWTAWNHVRTLAPLVSAVAFIMALR